MGPKVRPNITHQFRVGAWLRTHRGCWTDGYYRCHWRKAKKLNAWGRKQARGGLEVLKAMVDAVPR